MFDLEHCLKAHGLNRYNVEQHLIIVIVIRTILGKGAKKKTIRVTIIFISIFQENIF